MEVPTSLPTVVEMTADNLERDLSSQRMLNIAHPPGPGVGTKVLDH
jgi:hypothetical protein